MSVQFADILVVSVASNREVIKMYIKYEISLESFEFWSGAVDTVDYLTCEDLYIIERELEGLYPNGLDATTLNDIFWFDSDWIAELLGYEDFEALIEDRNN